MNYKTSVCPLIDIIKWDTFAYVVQDNGELAHEVFVLDAVCSCQARAVPSTGKCCTSDYHCYLRMKSI